MALLKKDSPSWTEKSAIAAKKIRIILNVASDLNIVTSKEKLFPFPKG
jgi:hypothetical protein